MKRFSVVLIVLLAVSAVGAFALEPYDSDVTVPIMRANGAALGQLRGAAAEADFLTSAGAFASLAQGSLMLLGYEAPQGSQEEWTRIHTELIEMALRGIIACSEEDAEVLSEIAGQIGGFSRQGHGQFR